MGEAAPEWLFSYGTLQLEAVQRAKFGRLLQGEPDSLPGFRLEDIVIEDDETVALSGLKVHRIAVRSRDARDRVPGMRFALTAAELAAADAYEAEDYARIRAILASGMEAWVYVRPSA
jgi:hypothetical protein